MYKKKLKLMYLSQTVQSVLRIPYQLMLVILFPTVLPRYQYSEYRIQLMLVILFPRGTSVIIF